MMLPPSEWYERKCELLEIFLIMQSIKSMEVMKSIVTLTSEKVLHLRHGRHMKNGKQLLTMR